MGPTLTDGAQDSAFGPFGGKQDRFLTGTAPSAFQFAFLFRTDLEQLRADLTEGRVSGPEAAARLLACERSVFAQPLLTGGRDVYGDSGLTPHEEWIVHTYASGQKPPQVADSGRGEQRELLSHTEDETEAETEETDVDDDSDAGSEVSLAAASDGVPPGWPPGKAWPSKAQTITALKVLGVLAEVPIGPKAPVDDEELPVCLHRLETVLRQLGAPEASLKALTALVEQDSFPDSQKSNENEGRSRRADSREISVNKTAPVGASSSPLLSTEALPLRQVLQSLRPAPLQKERSCCGCFGRCFRRLRRCFRRCGRRGKKSKRPRPEPENMDEEDGNSDTASNMPVVESQQIVSLRRRQFTERIFATHKLDKCALCCGSFRACKDPSCFGVNCS